MIALSGTFARRLLLIATETPPMARRRDPALRHCDNCDLVCHSRSNQVTGSNEMYYSLFERTIHAPNVRQSAI